MKHINRFLILCVLVFCTGVLSSQSIPEQNPPDAFPPDGTCFIPNSKVPNPTPQNGDGTHGQTFNLSKCGLNYTHATLRLGRRGSLNGVIQPATYVITGIPVCRTIERAYIYASLTGTPMAFNVTIVNPSSQSFTFPAASIGTAADKCWGYGGSTSIRVDVTTAITGNGNYIISGFPTNPPTPQKDTDGATLFIIYSDPTATYQGHMVIHDGAIVGIGGNTSSTITGINACANSTYARHFIMAGDFQLAGTTISITGGPNYACPWNWWNFNEGTVNVTAAQTVAVANVLIAPGDCYLWVVNGLYYQTTTCTTCVIANFNLTIASALVDASCNQCNGSITATPSGGSAPYSYVWNTTPAQTTQTITGLCAGTYIVNVTDASGCAFGIDTIVVNMVGGAGVSTTAAPVLCFGGSTGSATATATVGVPPFTYSWSTVPVQTNATATGLSAGTFTVTVTDSQGCTDTSIILVTEPPQLQAVTNVVNNALCFGSADGSVGVTPSGGTGSYSYSWLTIPAQTTQTATGLAAGTYVVVVTDANGCTTTQSVLVTEPTPVQNSIFFDAASCGLTDGQTTVTTLGGTGPYSYAWTSTPVQTNATATGLSPGMYTVTVTDANGCISTISVNVIDSAGPQANFIANPITVYMDWPIVNFTDLSINASSWYWTFGDPSDTSSSFMQHPSHTYSDTGTFCIWLYIANTVCTDSIQLCVEVLPLTNIWVPNAFTPNGDAHNEMFMPLGEFVSDFQMWIFDRWGMLIYSTTNMNDGWNGRVNNKGDLVQEDTYVWVIEYTDTKLRDKRMVGHVSVIK